MWSFKIAGVLILACSGLGVSYELNRRASDALRQNEGMMALLRTVRGQIECFARPISEILGGCTEAELVACGYQKEELPTDLSELLVWCLPRDEATIAIVSRFAEEFGRGYREDEVRACDYALSLLEERRACLASELPAKKKRNVALCVCASLALALLLL